MMPHGKRRDAERGRFLGEHSLRIAATPATWRSSGNMTWTFLPAEARQSARSCVRRYFRAVEADADPALAEEEGLSSRGIGM
jgi:hypothetical protein